MTYQVIDTRTNYVVAQRDTYSLAQLVADSKDREYGAVRYAVRLMQDRLTPTDEAEVLRQLGHHFKE